MALSPNEREQMADYIKKAEEAMRQRTEFYAFSRSVGIPTFTYEGPAKPESSLSALAKPIAKWLHKVDQSVGWNQIVGNERAKTELREAIEAATQDADLYKFYNMRPPKGILLWGPPGCGKTMFAKACVTALGADEYILLNGDEMQSKWVGETEEHIRDIFAYARAYKQEKGKPLLIFLDEAEAALPVRSEYHATWRNNQVNQWLSELDGLLEYGAFLVLATNRPDSIDQALLRDGRIERKIKVTRPDREAVATILWSNLADLPLNSNIASTFIIDALWDNDLLLRELTNPHTGARHRFLLHHIISGAMVAGLVARAKSIAFRRDKAAGTRTGISLQDLLGAITQLYEENRGLSHSYALAEFIEDVALPAEAIKGLN